MKPSVGGSSWQFVKFWSNLALRSDIPLDNFHGSYGKKAATTQLPGWTAPHLRSSLEAMWISFVRRSLIATENEKICGFIGWLFVITAWTPTCSTFCTSPTTFDLNTNEKFQIKIQKIKKKTRKLMNAVFVTESIFNHIHILYHITQDVHKRKPLSRLS